MILFSAGFVPLRQNHQVLKIRLSPGILPFCRTFSAFFDRLFPLHKVYIILHSITSTRSYPHFPQLFPHGAHLCGYRVFSVFSSFWKTRKHRLSQFIHGHFVYITNQPSIFAVIPDFSLTHMACQLIRYWARPTTGGMVSTEMAVNTDTMLEDRRVSLPNF